jgi:hypothetical protein
MENLGPEKKMQATAIRVPPSEAATRDLRHYPIRAS